MLYKMANNINTNPLLSPNQYIVQIHSCYLEVRNPLPLYDTMSSSNNKATYNAQYKGLHQWYNVIKV